MDASNLNYVLVSIDRVRFQEKDWSSIIDSDRVNLRIASVISSFFFSVLCLLSRR